VGCLMDIFSAIVVVVPLIIPIGLAFGVDPLHLGILFLANLELGYLTPPVGMNLFLASYRFDKPLTVIYRTALPFLGILAVGVLFIAYVPKLTTWHLDDAGSQPDINWDEVEPANTGDTLDIPDNIDLMQELLAEDPVEEPTQGETETAPRTLEIPEGANLLDELNTHNSEDDGG